MHSNRSIPSQFRVYTAVPGDLLAMGKNTQRSVSYGKNYSEGVPQDLVTDVATAVLSRSKGVPLGWHKKRTNWCAF